ncbi:MAG: sulfur carrier protein ThiS adenylyltransferase ThiF [Bacteroidetes bacterium]|nr:sulfur carrier protein ThiS adenylyltransferase ThiF [Bacteroidota bacterium]MBL7105010.1 sulfur carrier protein ThiS adenylyltransferase ThiF [Bacteroidales bacterium]
MTFKEIKKIAEKKTIGIAGAGGLGSNSAVALARVGIGSLIIADFDIVTKENLNRQHYFCAQIGKKKVFALKENIFKINSDVKVFAHAIRLNPENIVKIFKKCNVIVEAFDDAGMKQMIIETVLGEMPDIPLVVGLGVAGWGNNNSIGFRQEGNLYICGDEKTEIADDIPPLAPRVGIVANMQANTVLEIILKGK